MKRLIEELEDAARKATTPAIGCVQRSQDYFHRLANPQNILQLTQALREAVELIKTNRRYIMPLTEKQCTDVQLILDLNDAFLARFNDDENPTSSQSQ